MLPAEFKAFVKDRCREVHEELRKKSVALFYIKHFYWRVTHFIGKKYCKLSSAAGLARTADERFL